MWLIEKSVFKTINDARENNTIFSEDQHVKFNSFFSESEQSKYSIVDDVGVIPITGVLTDAPDIFSFFFGGGNTTYQSIIDATKSLENEDNIKKIQYAIDSPGGQASSKWAEAMDAIFNCSKPTEVLGGNLVASAAYGLASQADKILANNKLSTFGSIGVVFRTYVDDNEVTITNTESPNKAPDLKTEEGKKSVVEQLDSIHDVFVGNIARGRNVTSEKVNNDFGKGSVFLAEKAIQKNMIDSISTINTTAVKSGIKREKAVMDIEKLKAEHPDVFKAAVDLGVNQEKDRVNAHLTLGSTGDMKYAVKCIEDGSPVSQTVIAKQTVAIQARADFQDLQEDSADTETVTATEEGLQETVSTPMAKALAILEEKRSLESGVN